MIPSISLFNSPLNKKLEDFDKNLRSAFKTIKEEIEDHKQSINENTNEIQSNYEFLCRIDAKVDKLSERIDEITMFIQQMKACELKKEKEEVAQLTTKEQEVFLVLYTSHASLSYAEIAEKSGLSSELVSCYITNLITKGVPIIKKYIGNDVFLTIDESFKLLQAKENIVKINEVVSSNICT